MLPEIISFQKWLRRKAPFTSTQIHYTSDVVLFFQWVMKPVDQITVQDIDHFIEEGQHSGYHIATLNRRLAAIRTFYHFLAIELEMPPRNPVIPKRHFIRQGLRLPRDLQDTDVQKLFSVIHYPRDRAIFLLMLRCGIRVGEIRNLSMPDLYLDPTPGNLPRLWLHGKGGKERVVYLSHQPLQALLCWLKARPNVKDHAVFINRFGKRISVTGIQSRLARYCHQAEIWVTCHQLRHTFGRHLTEARVPVTTIQRLMGHSHLATTQIYLHLSDRNVQNDYDAAMQEICRELLPQDSQK